MKRRSLWIVCVALPLVTLGLFLRAAASWRPVVFGRFPQGVAQVSSLDVWPDRVLYTGQNQWGDRRFGWFDVRSGEAHKDVSIAPRRVGMDGDFSWVLWLDGANAGALEVTDGQGKRRVFKGHEVFYPERGEVSVRILPGQNRVVLLARDVVYEWEFASGRLKRTGKFNFRVVLPEALSRDGRTFVGLSMEDTGFVVGDIRSGKIVEHVPLRTSYMMEYGYTSVYGGYCLFDQPDGTMKVVDTATGKALWSFPIVAMWFMDHHEENVFVDTGKEWQVRGFKTGKIVRRLARVPDAEDAAVSPDGGTLYSVAGGALYRQRVF